MGLRMVEREKAGFTLLELMIVVAIIGILAAIAVPSFIRYVAKAKSAEVETQLEKLSTGARAYYMDQHVGSTMAASTLPQQFPEPVALTPALSCCTATADKCAPQNSLWDNPSWQALQFSLDDPHYYRYEFDSAMTGVDAEFTARAFGDLDCDNILSTFERYGWIQVLGNDITIQAGTYKENRLE